MKTIACYALHYGLEYLPWSIRSIQDSVDEIHIFYTDKPSYGFTENLPCPESEAQLQEAAHRFLNKPLYWHRGTWGTEGAHKSSFMEKAREIGATLILCVDSDELWVPGSAERSLKYVYDSNCAGRWMFRFRHFWRSFNYEVRDFFEPIRIVDMRYPITLDARMGAAQTDLIYHYSMVQSRRLIEYKWTCHGHKKEFKPNWLQNVFFSWTPGTQTVGTLHPTSNQIWDAVYPVSDEVKENNRILLHDHPYFGLELVP